MFTIISIILMILAIFIHEWLGHATEIRRMNIRVTKLALGLPYGPSVSFPLKGKWEGTDFIIHYLCPIGAYTEYDGKAVSALPYWQQSRIHASGPFVSLIFGYFLILIAGLIAIAERPEIDIWYFPHLPFLMPTLLTVLSIGLILRFGGKIIFTYLVPLMPFAIALFVAYHVFFPEPSVATTGPIALIAAAGRISEFSGAFFFSGNMSNVLFGFSMMLPLRIFSLAFDGEEILTPIMQKYFPKAVDGFERCGSIIFGLLLLYGLKIELTPIILPFLAEFLT